MNRIISFVFALVACSHALAALPAVPVPSENPITEEKRILGKILFWDEQLSTDNTVACGTCHIPSAAGGDPRVGNHPGPDGVFATIDDVIGSPGVVRRDSNGIPIDDPVFGFDVQVTGRQAPNFFGGIFSPSQFWDGRAEGQLIDPLDDVTVAIAAGGSLEIQSLGPILSSVEMAKDNRTWQEVTDKLAAVTPLEFASSVPADMAAVLTAGVTYGDLFSAAFGDPAITPVRIAFALATYERTLVPNQSPFDLGTMSAAEQAGFDVLVNDPPGPAGPPTCLGCHGGNSPTVNSFTGNRFRNIGVAHNPAVDTGRESVTSNPADLGSFKTPTLRNVGVKPHFMHDGSLTTLPALLAFYAGPQNSAVNLDPLMPSPLPPDPSGVNTANVIAFLQTGLTDPRVAAGTFPFDAPTLTAAGEIDFDAEVMEENVPIPLPALALLAIVICFTGVRGSKRRPG